MKWKRGWAITNLVWGTVALLLLVIAVAAIGFKIKMGSILGKESDLIFKGFGTSVKQSGNDAIIGLANLDKANSAYSASGHYLVQTYSILTLIFSLAIIGCAVANTIWPSLTKWMALTQFILALFISGFAFGIYLQWTRFIDDLSLNYEAKFSGAEMLCAIIGLGGLAFFGSNLAKFIYEVKGKY